MGWPTEGGSNEDLSLNEAACAAEIVRSGIISVDPGQREAATALGLPRHRRFPADRPAAGVARDPDFASYRDDNLAFATTKDSTWTLRRRRPRPGRPHRRRQLGHQPGEDPPGLAEEARGRGPELEVRYYKDNNSTYLALASGRIDAYFGPNPGIDYQDQQSAGTSTPTRTAGTYSGAGDTLQCLIAATTKKDSGLAKPVADTINYLIKNGQYDAWLKAYNLQNEAVKTPRSTRPGSRSTTPEPARPPAAVVRTRQDGRLPA